MYGAIVPSQIVPSHLDMLDHAGFRLSALTLICRDDQPIRALLSPHLRRLRSLCLDSVYVTQMVDAELLVQVFAHLTQLTDLNLNFCGRHKPGSLRACTWSLPELLHLRLNAPCDAEYRTVHESQFTDLPLVVAPKLVSLTASTFVDAHLLDVCGACTRLSSLHLSTSADHVTEEDVAALRQRLRAMLTSGAWPCLTELKWDDHRMGLAHALAALARPPLPLRVLDCRVPQAAGLTMMHALLATHSQLQRLRVFLGEATESEGVQEVAATTDGAPMVPQLEYLCLTTADDACFAPGRFPRLTKLELFSKDVCLSSLDRVLTACPALRTLKMVDVNLHTWAPSRTCASVRELDVTGLPTAATRHLSQLLAAFPDLTRLRVRSSFGLQLLSTPPFERASSAQDDCAVLSRQLYDALVSDQRLKNKLQHVHFPAMGGGDFTVDMEDELKRALPSLGTVMYPLDAPAPLRTLSVPQRGDVPSTLSMLTAQAALIELLP